MAEANRLGCKVLWVSGNVSPHRHPLQYLRSLTNGHLDVRQSLWHTTLWTLPPVRFWKKTQLVNRFHAAHIRLALKRIGCVNPVLLLYTPEELELAKLLPRVAIVYWTGDEVTLPGEQHLLDSADLVLGVSTETVIQKRTMTSAAVFQTSTGVPFEMFYKFFRTQSIPADLRHLPRPIIGYGGTITGTRIDLTLLDYLASVNRNASFVFVGPLHDDARSFVGARENVHYLGCKRYEDWPMYINAFDVCIVPYLLNRFNSGSNPLKVYEYLALGKSVVATPVPAIVELSPVVTIANTPSAFNDAVRLALSEEPSSATLQARLDVARRHSTASIATRMLEILSRGDQVDRSSAAHSLGTVAL